MAQRIDVSVEGLYQLLHRIEHQALQTGDWAICGALVLQQITSGEKKLERIRAKIGAGAHGPALPAGATVDVEYTVVTPSTESGAADTAGQPGEAEADGKKKAKGHGRNGAGAYVNAKHVVHSL